MSAAAISGTVFHKGRCCGGMVVDLPVFSRVLQN
jgi:hypothetical protein